MTDPKIYYRIVSRDEAEHAIVVRFWSDLLPEAALVSTYQADGKTPARYRTDYNITLPIPTPTGDALHALIMQSCPVEWFSVKHATLDPAIDTAMAFVPVGTMGVVAPPAPGAPTVADYEAAVQRHMDSTAWLYGYDSLISAISYADEGAAPAFQAEGQAFRAWRSLVWIACREVLARYEAGEIPAPTVDELIAELPALDLPPPTLGRSVQ
jgi:hypothetical protein